MKRPLAGTVIVFAGGIWTASWLVLDLSWLMGAIMLGLGLFLTCHNQRTRPAAKPAWNTAATICFWLLIFTSGSLVYRSTLDHRGPSLLARTVGDQPRAVTVRGVVTSDAHDETRFQLATDSLFQNDRWSPISGRVLVFIDQQDASAVVPADDRTRLRYGDHVECTLFLRPPRPPRNPGSFDFAAWLARQDIHLVGSIGDAESCHIINRDAGHPIRALSFWLRQRLGMALRVGLETEPQVAGALAGMVLGERAEIPPETRAVFQQTGAFHVFAISGLHVGLVTLLVMLALRVVRVPPRWCGLVAIPILILYVYATGARPGAVRALIMAVVFLLGQALVRPTDLPTMIAAAALVILVMDPLQLFAGGFILSFTVVTVLVVLTPRLARLLEQWTAPDPFLAPQLVPAWRRHRWTVLGLRWVNNLVAGSVSAWIGLIPLMAMYFNLFTPVSILANLVAVPLLAAVIALGLGAILVYPLWGALAEIVNNANYLVLHLLQTAIAGLGQVPGGHCFVQTPPLWGAVIYYLVLGLLLLPLIHRDRPWRVRLMILGGSLVALAGWLLSQRNNGTVVTVLDLYRGQAMFVDVAGETEDLLVDTGDERGAERVVIPFLRSRGVDRLDTVMITSGTKSTLGGFDTITRLVPFRRVAESGLPTRSPDDIRWRAQTQTADWETMTVRAGDSWTTSDGLVVRILHPPRDWQRPRSADNALVFALEQHGHRILFLPAAGETVEQELLAHSASLLPAEVLVCGGHRQEPWATEALLDVVNPRVMVVAGPAAARPFGVRDPADPGLAKRLRQREIPVLRTAKSGAVRILLDDRGYSVEPWR